MEKPANAARELHARDTTPDTTARQATFAQDRAAKYLARPQCAQLRIQRHLMLLPGIKSKGFDSTCARMSLWLRVIICHASRSIGHISATYE